MEDKLYFTERRNELSQGAGQMKDNLIDDLLILVNRFQQRWTDMLNKQNVLTQAEQNADKLNPKV